jgi:lysozyme
VKTGLSGKELIKESESKRLKAYLPTPDDVWTIGFGSTLGVKKGMVITDEQAEEFLSRDLEAVERCINKNCTVPLTQNQFDALASFVYNLGCNAFKSSTLVRLLNEGQYNEAADQFPRWNKQGSTVLKGLTVRRQKERELFLS